MLVVSKKQSKISENKNKRRRKMGVVFRVNNPNPVKGREKEIAMKRILLALVFVSLLSGCQVVSRNFGGTVTIKLPEGETLINATWKESNLWVLTKDANGKMHFREYSVLGMLQGKVEFN
jgi:hypothetical protein